MSKPDAVLTTQARRVGRKIHIYDRLDSTNALALSLDDAPDAPDGLVILAREQTAGRGQHGRSWLSPPDSSVLMSALVRVPDRLRRPVVLTAWAAVAVCEVIESGFGIEPTVKWPNDVLLGGRKVCGILIEQRRRAVVGIGLNVCQPGQHFEQAGLTEATSLAVATGRVDLEPASLARQLCRRLDLWWQRLLDNKLGVLEQSWRRFLRLTGRDVHAECHDGVREGMVVGLRFDGVLLQSPPPERLLHALLPETILHLTPRG